MTILNVAVLNVARGSKSVPFVMDGKEGKIIVTTVNHEN